MAQSVLVVEDDADIARLVRMTLEKEGYSVRTVADGAAAWDLTVRELPDVMILDVMLPSIDGLELCRRLRQEGRTANLPILMLSAKAEEIDRVVGLEIGADDYLTKPFSPRELAARVKALLRRRERTSQEDECLHSGPLEIDLARHEISASGRSVQLSNKEFGLLVHLVRGHGRVFTRAQLLDGVWGYDYVGGSRTVDVHIKHLRAKIPEIADYIVTVQSVGYKYVESSAVR